MMAVKMHFPPKKKWLYVKLPAFIQLQNSKTPPLTEKTQTPRAFAVLLGENGTGAYLPKCWQIFKFSPVRLDDVGCIMMAHMTWWYWGEMVGSL